MTGARSTVRSMPLDEAVTELARSGQTIALEGFTHLIPFAAAHEIIRQELRDLTLLRLTPDVVYDQMIGMGTVARLVFSYAGNPGVGSLHRFRDAVENGWPRALRTLEHSHAGMANAYVAGASDLPFAVLRGYRDTGLAAVNDEVTVVRCPFTNEALSAVRALRPELAVIHAQQADRRGNVMLWGLVGVQKEAALAAEHVLVTVEELVDELKPRAHATILPAWTVTAISVVPNGAWPSYAAGYSTRDNSFYRDWDEISRDRERFQAWMSSHVLGASALTTSAPRKAADG
jgi:glutaconate CoA-transferase subunit A